MRKLKFVWIGAMLLIIWTLTACSSSNTPVHTRTPMEEQLTGQIYLYGEIHAIEKILDRELELWSEYYRKDQMRHLFIEKPYYTAEFLNEWMESDNDDILERLFKDLEKDGAAGGSPYAKTFYKRIKKKYPETVFHGTDIGHQYATTGRRFLKYLKDNNLDNTERYVLTQEAIQQGKDYYQGRDGDVYRENKMTENFIREMDKLKDENIMGIYGAAHTDFEGMDFTTQSVPTMANQLKQHYGEDIHSEDLSWLAKDIKPIKKEKIVVNGTKYQASYFGKEDLDGFRDYAYWEFWRLENAYEDFKDNKKTGNVQPNDTYPMAIDMGQVLIIDLTKKDGSVERKYFLFDGRIWEGRKCTEEIEI